MKITITLLSLCVASTCATTFAQTAAQSAPTEVSASAAASSDETKTPPARLQTVSVSQVRIVRLSQVAGQVELDRKTDQKFDVAFVNLPIVSGAGLRTKQGVAEVEFEDNSSLRLTPQSEVEFPRLGRDVSGATITGVNLIHGSVYISLADGKSNGDFTVTAGNQTIVLTPSTHLRIDLDAPVARMLVYQGSATITGPSGSMVVGKKKAISFDTASATAPEFVRIGDAGSFDNWDKNAVDYHKVRTVAANGFTGSNGFAGSPYAYGSSDLNYYGSFSNVAGCGTMWRPYLASASFDPYSSGVWSWYPGQGYSFVSLYPWGWTPYHSGSWNYCPAGGGWGWSPQGNWNGLTNYPTNLVQSTMPVKGGVNRPVRPTPPPPPVRGGATLVPVNVKSLQASQQGADGKFVFRNDSAGIGVPRGVFNNLGKISQNVATHGSATSSLSEHQTQIGFMAPSRPSTSTSASSASSASRSSMSQARGSSTSSPSPSFGSSRSMSTGSSPSGSAGSNAAAGSSGAHH